MDHVQWTTPAFQPFVSVYLFEGASECFVHCIIMSFVNVCYMCMCMSLVNVCYEFCECLRFGYAEFSSPQHAQKAMKLAGREMEGREVRLDVATPRPDGGGGGAGNRGRGNSRGTPRGGRGQTVILLNCSFLFLSYNDVMNFFT